MNTWLFTDYKGRFHTTARPWTTWHAPIIGPYFLKRLKVLSHAGPSATTPARHEPRPRRAATTTSTTSARARPSR